MSPIFIVLIVFLVLGTIAAIALAAISYLDAQKKVERETLYSVRDTIITVPTVSNVVNASPATVVSGTKTAIVQGSTQQTYYATIAFTPQNPDNQISATINLDPSGVGNLTIDNYDANASYTLNGFSYAIPAGISYVSGHSINVIFQPSNASVHNLQIELTGLPTQ